MRLVGCALSALLFSAQTLLVSCSPGMFTGNNDRDKEVAEQKTYRRVNLGCSELNLSGSSIDVSTFRKVLDCYNSYGGIDPLVRLTRRLSDSELAPLVRLVNEKILDNPKLHFQLESTFNSLAEKGILDQTFVHIGRLLENRELVGSSVSLIREAYDSSEESKRLLLQGLEKLSTRLEPQTMSEIIDALIALASAPAFESLQKKLRGDSLHGRELSTLVAQVFEYLNDTDPGHVKRQLGTRFLKAFADESLFRVVNDLAGVSEEEVRTRLPQISAVFKVLFKTEIREGNLRNGRLMDEIASLYHLLREPVECFGGAATMLEPDLKMLRDVVEKDSKQSGDYYRRANYLRMIVGASFCKFPKNISHYYRSMIEFADSSTVETSTDIVKSFYRHRQEMLLIDLFSDTGSGGFGRPAEDTAGAKRLLPLFAEFTDRQLWDDLLLLGSLWRPEQQGKLAGVFKFVDQNLWEAFIEVVLKTEPAEWSKLLKSFKPFIESDEPWLRPTVQGLRSAFYVNDIHPFIDFLRQVLSDVSTHRDWVESLLLLSKQPEFEETVGMISDMAKSKDGELRQFFSSIVSLFHHFALRAGDVPVRPAKEPPFSVKTRHHLRVDDLAFQPITQKIWDERDPCRKLDMDVLLSNQKSSRFDSQLEHFLSCLNEDGSHAALDESVRFLLREKTSDRGSYYSLFADSLREFSFSPDEAKEIGDRVIRASEERGSFYDFFNAIPLVVSGPASLRHSVLSSTGGPAQPIVKPLIAVARKVMEEARLPVRRLLDYGAEVLKRPDAGEILNYLDEVLDRPAPPTLSSSVQLSLDLKSLERWIGQKECLRGADLIARTAEIQDEFARAATNGELLNGRRRFDWHKTEIKDSVKPLLDKADGPVIDALFNGLRYFDLKPGDDEFNNQRFYPADHLFQWLKTRSDDVRPILYFYPGEKSPRVKLVNTLDRLELLLVNADFTFGPIQNHALKFLEVLATAWGDEPRELWPDEVQRRYPDYSSERPPTLREAYEEIKGSLSLFKKVGFPKLPGCLEFSDDAEAESLRGRTLIPFVSFEVKARNFNIHQVFSVIEENLPDSGFQQAGGLAVLRNIFYELHRSSPRKGNNLTLIPALVRLGFFRQIGKALSQISANEQPAWQEFFRGLVKGSVSPKARSLVKNIMTGDPNRSLIWAVADELFILKPEDRFGDLTLYTVALFSRLGLIEPAVNMLDESFRQYRSYLLKQTERVPELMHLPSLALGLRHVFDDEGDSRRGRLVDLLNEIVSEPLRLVDLLAVLKAADSTPDFAALKNHAEALRGTPEYRRLNLGGVVTDFRHFLGELPKTRGRPDAARALRRYAAQLMASRSGKAPGVVEEFLMLSHSDGIHQTLETLSHYISNGDFFAFIKDSRNAFIQQDRVQ